MHVPDRNSQALTVFPAASLAVYVTRKGWPAGVAAAVLIGRPVTTMAEGAIMPSRSSVADAPLSTYLRSSGRWEGQRSLGRGAVVGNASRCHGGATQHVVQVG